MAVDFSKADLVISVGQKSIGSFVFDANGILTFPLADDEWNELVVPVINGTWHIQDVDNLDWLYYWKSSNDGDGLESPAFYIAEKTDLTGDIPNNYNQTPNNGGLPASAATEVYNALKARLQQGVLDWRSEQTRLLEESERLLQFLPDSTIPATIESLKVARDVHLADSDWTQLPDNALTDEQRAAWAAYRQELRDFPATCLAIADPYDPLQFPGWPTKPQ